MIRKRRAFSETPLKSFNFWPFSILGRRLAAVRKGVAQALLGAVEAMVCCVAYYETRRRVLRQRWTAPDDQANAANAANVISAANVLRAHGSEWSRALSFQCAGLAVPRMRRARLLRAVFPALRRIRILLGVRSVSEENFPADFAGLPVRRAAGRVRLTASYKEHGALRMRTLAGAFGVQVAHEQVALAKGGLTTALINVNPRCAG